MSNTRARSYGRRSNNPFSASTFKLEGLSQFDWSHTVSYSSDFGDLRPVECFDLIIGTRMRTNLSYVLNMDPLRKPLYAGINVTYDACYCSDMLLGYDSESFFNPSEQLGIQAGPIDGLSVQQPYANGSSLLYYYYVVGSFLSQTDSKKVAFVPRPFYNTLFDSFGLPFNSRYYDVLGEISLTFNNGSSPSRIFLSELFKFPLFETVSSDNSPYPAGLSSFDGPWVTNVSDLFVPDIDSILSIFYPYSVDAKSQSLFAAASDLATSHLTTKPTGGNYIVNPKQSQLAANNVPFFSVLRYLWRYIDAPVSAFASLEAWESWLVSVGLAYAPISDQDAITWDSDAICRRAGFASYQEFLDVYKSYLYSIFFASVANKNIDLRPYFAYRRIYNDLYVNTNLWDCDNFAEFSIDAYYKSNSYNSAPIHRTLASGFSVSGSSAPAYVGYFLAESGTPDGFLIFNDFGFLKRWWSNDMYTSAVPADMSAAANAVEIPAAGLTLIDLRNYNIEQEVQERINYAGVRVTDSTFAFFGFKSPELRYRFARHIGRIQDTPRIDNVLQNSASTSDSPLATPAGYGYGSKSARFFDFQMPWYGFVMILQSVMTEPVYRDAVDRMVLQKDYEDFLFPPYQEISDIAVMNMEVQPTGVPADSEGFGYQRSYYYYMRKNSLLRGTMRLAEKIDWNLSRDMRDGFALNSDFATPNSSDRLNRIFSDTSDGINHFNFFVGLDIQVTLPLKRDIHYHL